MIVECIKIRYSDAIRLGQRYIVMGLYFKNVLKDEKVNYVLYDEGMMVTGFDESYFKIIDNQLPSDWSFCKLYDNCYLISFPEFCSYDNFDRLYEGESVMESHFKKRHTEILNRYRDREIDEFFTHAEKYGITDSEKKTMLEYYKSLPDSTQWEQDKELLMLNSSK